MTNAKTVAEYMTFELKRRGGVLYQYDIADRIIQRFGREFVVRGLGRASRSERTCCGPSGP